jgi:cytochrome c-type biogenesis protein
VVKKGLNPDIQGLTFILAAGASALFSPCGFPMFPGLITYYMGTRASLGKAIRSGLVCTLGLVTVFSAIGLMASIVGSVINPYIPFLDLVAGAATILFGVSILVEIRLPMFPMQVKAPERRGAISIFLYGFVYGLATLGCSAPVFFSVLFWAIAGNGPLYGIVTFFVYAIGMGLPLIATTILVSMAKERVLRKMVKVLPLLQKISGIILIIIGIYVVYLYFSFFYTI